MTIRDDEEEKLAFDEGRKFVLIGNGAIRIKFAANFLLADMSNCDVQSGLIRSKLLIAFVTLSQSGRICRSSPSSARIAKGLRTHMPTLEQLPPSGSSTAPGLVDAWNPLQGDMVESKKARELARLELQWIRQSREIDRGWLTQRLMAICPQHIAYCQIHCLQSTYISYVHSCPRRLVFGGHCIIGGEVTEEDGRLNLTRSYSCLLTPNKIPRSDNRIKSNVAKKRKRIKVTRQERGNKTVEIGKVSNIRGKKICSSVILVPLGVEPRISTLQVLMYVLISAAL